LNPSRRNAKATPIKTFCVLPGRAATAARFLYAIALIVSATNDTLSISLVAEKS
jgi:hypothetical protein